MTEGAVNAAYEAVVRLTVQGPSGQAREIEAVVDTGYCVPLGGGSMRDADMAAFTQSPRPTAPTRPKDEIARLGDAIYERDIRPKVEAGHYGEIVSIDVDSGNWAIGADVIAARDRLRTQCPGAVNVLFERVGHRALAGFGGGFLRRNE